jgi:hypothetical protein
MFGHRQSVLAAFDYGPRIVQVGSNLLLDDPGAVVELCLG